MRRRGRPTDDPRSIREAEANHFAMHLLVPDSLLEKEDLSNIDFTDDKSIKTLANKFNVSMVVMTLRLVEFFKR